MQVWSRLLDKALRRAGARRLSDNLANSYLVRKTEDFADQVVLEKPCRELMPGVLR